MAQNRAMLAHILLAMAGVAGLIGIIAGLSRHTWRMSPSGWFLLGILGTTGALVLLAQEALARRK